MKKFLVTAVMLFVFAVGLPLSVEAHNNCRNHARSRKANYSRNYRARNYNNRYRSPRYSTAGYQARRPSFYRRHRNLINMAIGTGGGALIGGLLGGKRGALIGAGTGLGASALYTYKLVPKKRRYYRY